jgi:hypothetical protein
MSNFLEYHPHLTYKRKLEAILEDYETEDVSMGHPQGVEQKSPSDLLEKNGYVPNEAIRERVDATPTDVIVNMAEAKTKIATLVDKIVEKLKEDVTKPIHIDDYMKAKEENNKDITYAFEDFHSDNIEGSTAAETLPVLKDLEEELNSLGEFAGSNLFPQELDNDLDYLASQIERLEKEEEAEVSQLIEADKNGLLDVDPINEKNHILHFLSNRAESISKLTEDVDRIISASSESIHGKSGSRIKDIATNHTSLRKEFHKLNLRRFLQETKNAYDARQRMLRLVDKSYKRKLLDEVVKFQEEKLKSRDSLSALYQLNPDDEGDPLNIYLFELVDDIQRVKDTCDSLVEDLYKIVDLEHLQMMDYLMSLEGKNVCRQVNSIISSIDGATAEDELTEREIQVLNNLTN